MQKSINILLTIILTGALVQGALKIVEWHLSREKLKALEARMTEMRRKEQSLSRYKGSVPPKLKDIYAGFINDMRSVARVYGAGMTIDGVNPLFVPSELEGLSVARIKVTFAHLSDRGELVSLLEALDSCARSFPFLMQRLSQEKDSLVLEVTLLGV